MAYARQRVVKLWFSIASTEAGYFGHLEIKSRLFQFIYSLDFKGRLLKVNSRFQFRQMEIHRSFIYKISVREPKPKLRGYCKA